jgi:hypothetical protein
VPLLGISKLAFAPAACCCSCAAVCGLGFRSARWMRLACLLRSCKTWRPL